MGVVNVTPDSFYPGSRFPDESAAVERALTMVEAGADIIDIGGESTRPGAEELSESQELDRVIPVVERVRRDTEVMLSVDTRKAAVAKRALEAGADVINDVSALSADERMASVVAEFRAGVVLMHMKGRPKTMQEQPRYEDVVAEVRAHLQDQVGLAERAGIRSESILVDPGIGFGKSLEHNLILLNRIPELRSLRKPILVGTSRKSFLGRILSRPPEQRLFATASSIACAVLRGAHLVRVHDVAEMRDVLLVADAVKNENAQSGESR